jgi:hypothetical protein
MSTQEERETALTELADTLGTRWEWSSYSSFFIFDDDERVATLGLAVMPDESLAYVLDCVDVGDAGPGHVWILPTLDALRYELEDFDLPYKGRS